MLSMQFLFPKLGVTRGGLGRRARVSRRIRGNSGFPGVSGPGQRSTGLSGEETSYSPTSLAGWRTMSAPRTTALYADFSALPQTTRVPPDRVRVTSSVVAAATAVSYTHL